jgi:hypothetical protein
MGSSTEHPAEITHGSAVSGRDDKKFGDVHAVEVHPRLDERVVYVDLDEAQARNFLKRAAT